MFAYVKLDLKYYTVQSVLLPSPPFPESYPQDQLSEDIFPSPQLIMPHQKADPLLVDDTECKESSTESLPLFEYNRKHRTCYGSYHRRVPHWPWILSTIFFAFTSFMLLVQSRVRVARLRLNVQEYGMSSELGMNCLLC